MNKEQLLKQLKMFSLGTGGIGNWLTEETHPDIFMRLQSIEQEPLTRVQLNQLLVLGHQAPLSNDFFEYYWLNTPKDHPYDVTRLPGFQRDWTGSTAIKSIEHLKWGLYRLFVDGLLWVGNVRFAYRLFRTMSTNDLVAFFDERRFDTELIRRRGPALPLKPIPKDDRYLISEMACKSYGDRAEIQGALKDALLQALRTHLSGGGGRITIRKLLEGEHIKDHFKTRQQEFIFSADDVLDESVESAEELDQKYGRVARQFSTAREAAISNTHYYLSMVGDLDVYVATSMRTRQDFRNMAVACEKIFSDTRLQGLQLRYFDPTLSAASGHEDKGIIECLMVKCAKALVYCAGEKESYGKDAEAAMALSLGKPVIFLCDHEQKSRFYREVHPLSRLIQFETGVAVGAMVTDSTEQVSELLWRIFSNKLEYQLEHSKRGYLKLKESLTDSVVRLQTSDRLIAETFWNHYHNR